MPPKRSAASLAGAPALLQQCNKCFKLNSGSLSCLFSVVGSLFVRKKEKANALCKVYPEAAAWYTHSINYYTRMCISDMLNGCHTTKLATSAWLSKRFELYAFKSSITTTHQKLGRCSTMSQAWKKYVQKSHKSQEMTLLMFWFLDWSSAVKCKTVGSCDKPQPAWRALRTLLSFVFKKWWDSQHLMWPSENSWWQKGKKCPC